MLRGIYRRKGAIRQCKHSNKGGHGQRTCVRVKQWPDTNKRHRLGVGVAESREIKDKQKLNRRALEETERKQGNTTQTS